MPAAERRALSLLAAECRRSALALDDVSVERAALTRAALASWQGPAAGTFHDRSRRADAATSAVVHELRDLARELERQAAALP